MIEEDKQGSTAGAASQQPPASTAAPALAPVQVGNREVEVKSRLEREIWEALKECYDPEIPVNIVDLGLVYDLKVEEEVPGEANAFIKMTLTAPGCGMGPMIGNDVRRRTQQVPGVKNVMVELVFDPVWNVSMMSEAARLMLNLP